MPQNDSGDHFLQMKIKKKKHTSEAPWVNFHCHSIGTETFADKII